MSFDATTPLFAGLAAAALIAGADLDKPGLVIDNFAGGGGASTGIERGLAMADLAREIMTGVKPAPRKVDKAVNHSPTAIAIHKVNHPGTEHFCQNIYQVDPLDVTQGAEVDSIHFSPDCTDFSLAKGGKPKAKNRRDLAWTIPQWAERVRPKLITMENVREWLQWCDIDAMGKLIGPDETEQLDILPETLPAKKLPKRGARAPLGPTFLKWRGAMVRLGYKVEWKLLRGRDYGDPTTRLRLFIIMRCDGRPIVWPQPTHGDPTSEDVKAGRLLPFKTAANDVIDWSIECPSIFDRARPLKDATCKRIAAGIVKFVLNNARPFIIPVCHTKSQSRTAHSIDEGLPTVTTAKGGEFALVTPYMIPLTHQGGQARVFDIEGQAPTVTGANRGELGLITAHIAPIIDSQYGKSQCARADEPLPAVMAGGGGKQALVTATLEKAHLVAAFMAQHNAGFYTGAGQPVDVPLSTITSSGSHQQLVTANIIKLRNNCIGQEVTEPLDAVAAKGTHFGLVSAFLTKYYGKDEYGQAVDRSLDAVTGADRFGLVTVIIDGETYAVVDICMRMLVPRELARAQGWPEDYVLDPVCDYQTPSGKWKHGKLPKSYQVDAIGNGVNPGPMSAIYALNDPQLPYPQQERMAA